MQHDRLVLAFFLLLAGACNGILDVGDPDVQGPEDERRTRDSAAGAGGSGEKDEPTCGDGAIQQGEECDDGNTSPGDGCDACVVECGIAPEFKDETTHTCYRHGGQDVEETWEDAEARCEEWGGALAVLTTTDELALVQVHIRADTWIGGRGGEDGLTWVTGEPWEFASWAPDQPAGEGCVAIEGDLAVFVLRDCSAALRYTCERRPPSKTPQKH
jgi:cysteine-rich repeat protein